MDSFDDGFTPSSNRKAVIGPLAPERYRLQLTVSRKTYDRLRRAQDLMRHSIPGGDITEIVDRALALLVAELERKKLGLVARPRPQRCTAGRSRHIPSSVKREVWRRDNGQCAFVGAEGRCTERAFLEFHHCMPYSDHGPATTANIELRCRAPNAYEAAQHFGPAQLSFIRESVARYVADDQLGPDRVVTPDASPAAAGRYSG